MYEVEGAEKFAILAKALRQFGEKDLRKELYAGLNRAVKPLTAHVKESTPQFLPTRYAKELSKSLRVKQRRRAGKDPAIFLVGSAKTRKGKERDLTSLNRGRLRHTLFGDRRNWYDQSVRPDWWDAPIQEDIDDVRREVEKALDNAAQKLAAKL